MGLSDKILIIKALQLTKEDLVRALRTERICRENKDLSATNYEMFSNKLEALTAMQASNQASEYRRILNEALQIGISV